MDVTKRKVLGILNKVGAVITDSHIVYASWLHGTAYIDKDALYPHTKETSRLCREIAEQFSDDDVEAVVAPEKGGIILSQWVAFHLSKITGREVLAFYAEKKSGGFIVERGGARTQLRGRNVLVVEDVLTTGRSAKLVIEAVRVVGGTVIGLGALVNRGGITLKDTGNVPRLISLVNIKLNVWDKKDCFLCRDGVPVNADIGRGLEFLANQEK